MPKLRCKDRLYHCPVITCPYCSQHPHLVRQHIKDRQRRSGPTQPAHQELGPDRYFKSDAELARQVIPRVGLYVHKGLLTLGCCVAAENTFQTPSGWTGLTNTYTEQQFRTTRQPVPRDTC